jgi:hypothetical protein
MDRWWALVNTVMNLRVLKNAGKFLTSWTPFSFWRRILLHGVTKQVCKYTAVVGKDSFSKVCMRARCNQLCCTAHCGIAAQSWQSSFYTLTHS